MKYLTNQGFWSHWRKKIQQIQYCLKALPPSHWFASFSTSADIFKGWKPSYRVLWQTITKVAALSLSTEATALLSYRPLKGPCRPKSFTPSPLQSLIWPDTKLIYNTPPTLSTDWLEVIDLEQWRHLQNSMKPLKAPSNTLIQSYAWYSPLSATCRK